MNSQYAIIIGFLLVVSTILLTSNTNTAHASDNGKYSITTNEQGFAWVLNTDTGDLKLCFPQLKPHLSYICGNQKFATK